MRESVLVCAWAVLLGMAGPGTAPAAEASAASVESRVTWYANYSQAYKTALSEGKYLMIHFYDARCTRESFETLALNDSEILHDLGDYVVVAVPTDYQVEISPGRAAQDLKVDSQGQVVLASETKPEPQTIRLLGHESFRHMRSYPGVAIVDLKNRTGGHYGEVVSTFPFDEQKYASRESIRTIVELPPGSLTQRTMIYAVRMHPERPASTNGEEHPVLMREAAKHSIHQASIDVQGHHNWESRFHQISGEIGASPTEVVAESWPGETLVQAAIECVHSWRQSSGHWNAVRGNHRTYGYDMRLGGRGVWYGTGIFSN